MTSSFGLDQALKQLHDIEGLDSISIWPLAAGWWILAAMIILLLVSLAWYIAYRLTFKRSWKYDTLKKLAALEKNLSEPSARETAIILSEYVRRIALQQFPRQECASLSGETWLKWLSQHDPKKFDWEKKGKILLDIPYSPLHANLPLEDIKNLIQAVKHWVH